MRGPWRPHVLLTMALPTVLGLDENPGHLHGYEPLPASVCRQMAAEGTLRRLFTDPVTGLVVGIDGHTHPGGVAVQPPGGDDPPDGDDPRTTTARPDRTAKAGQHEEAAGGQEEAGSHKEAAGHRRGQGHRGKPEQRSGPAPLRPPEGVATGRVVCSTGSSGTATPRAARPGVAVPPSAATSTTSCPTRSGRPARATSTRCAAGTIG